MSRPVSPSQASAVTRRWIKETVESNDIVMFSKTTCTFCMQAKKILLALDRPFYSYEVDKMDDGKDIIRALRFMTESKTVPSIWLFGKYIGGCTDLTKMQQSGALTTLMAENPPSAPNDADVEQQDEVAIEMAEGKEDEEAPSKPRRKANKHDVDEEAPADAPRMSSTQLFKFPPTVNGNVVRVTGFWVVLLCILGVVYRDRTIMKFVVLGLFVDFALRFYAGSELSPLGLLSGVVVSKWRPNFIAGPSKQFAALVGAVFSGVSAAFLLGDLEVTGAVILAALGFFAALECFLGFCAGCFFFDIGIKLGTFSPHVFRTHIETLAQVEATYDRMHYRGDVPEPEDRVYTAHGTEPSSIDLLHKSKIDEYKWFDFSLVRHLTPVYFMLPLALSALAIAFKERQSVYVASNTFWNTFAIVGGIVYCIMLVLFFLRGLVFPQKVLKDWNHPVRGNAVALLPMNLCLYSYLLANDANMRAPFWVGASLLILLSFMRISNWYSRPQSFDAVNASWMITPLGNFIAALTGSIIDSDFKSALYLWFTFALVMYLVLLVVCSYKDFTGYHGDDRIRTSFALYAAASANASTALFVLESSYDLFSRLLFWVSFVYVCLAVMQYVNGFLEGNRFHMSMWGYGFASSAVAFASVTHSNFTPFRWALVLAYVLLVVACTINAVLALHSILAFINGDVFVPELKWGPLSFMKLTHEAIRDAFPRYRTFVASLEKIPQEELERFAAELTAFRKVHEVHSQHEEQVIFPEIERYYCGITAGSHEEHEDHEAVMNKLFTRLDDVIKARGAGMADAERDALCGAFRDSFEAFMTEMEQHLRDEEMRATVVVRKHFSIQLQRDIARRCFLNTSTQDMEIYVGWVLRSLVMQGMRTKFVRTFIWAVPDRMQLLGMMLYRVLPDLLWAEVTENNPEVIPRGLSGWRLYL